ncbi:hypothetical protein TREPR_0760 [Treponema primitia ZAS-2]|uniref:Uncharacterized protein n=1 Tax=Treponema primitia (strain ATCC BAA-887 / DSM 12427 / ZAS-2) TaxID=545694 RepID=F5YJC9_TREPZ|nr:hypothetical protein [Treponema primitia]AEF85456.1 hypothetical protein TREPR_0760 [Treponema primitia ZAS-2]
MQPIDHFFSKIIALEYSGGGAEGRNRLRQDFSRLVAPVLGASGAEDLWVRTLELIAGQGPEALRKLGSMAAFFIGDYDEETMALDKEDWQEIRETLEDVSGEINIDTLTELMGDLLSRGVLD